MNVALATLHSDAYAPLAEVTLPNKERYCRRHGYDLHAVRHPADAELGPNWGKVSLLWELTERYDAVLWLGCDTLITNGERTVESLLGKNPAADVLLASDLYGINADVILTRATAVARMFWYAVGTVGHAFYHAHPWSEQEAMVRFATTPPYAESVRVLPQSAMNSYLHAEYGRPADWPGGWQPGHFILHLPGMPLERRVELAREYAAKAV